MSNQPSSMLTPQDEFFSYEQWRERFLRAVLRGSCALGALAILLYLFSPTSNLYRVLAVLTYGVLVTVTLLEKVQYRIRASVFLFLLYFAGFSSLIDHGIGEFFYFSLAAGEVNVFKPDPGVFEHGLQRVNLSAKEAVYVGDNYYADVVGSRRAGLQPVLYDPLGIFPEPDCPTIRSFDELNSIIKTI